MARRISLHSAPAPPPRLTPYGAALLAGTMSLPVGIVLWIVEAIF